MGYHSLNSNKEQLIRYKQVSHLRKVDVICQMKKGFMGLAALAAAGAGAAMLM